MRHGLAGLACRGQMRPRSDCRNRVSARRSDMSSSGPCAGAKRSRRELLLPIGGKVMRHRLVQRTIRFAAMALGGKTLGALIAVTILASTPVRAQQVTG